MTFLTVEDVLAGKNVVQRYSHVVSVAKKGNNLNENVIH
jgi:hypothetical protein